MSDTWSMAASYSYGAQATPKIAKLEYWLKWASIARAGWN